MQHVWMEICHVNENYDLLSCWCSLRNVSLEIISKNRIEAIIVTSAKEVIFHDCLFVTLSVC